MIQVEDLVKKYGNRTVVDHLSFTIEQGQIYGFLGPNGAGKSTTMNVMTGYIAANGGTVSINGHDILKEPGKAKKCIGYLPEIPPLYMDMTVREYLLFVAELKKVPKQERKPQIDAIMHKTEIADVKDRLIKNISKGYKQRVGLAQALVGDPEVLILDEPMSGLDPKQIIEMRDLIKGLAKKHTVILSSHILSEVSAVCDHIMIIAGGRLVADGSPQELQSMMRTKAVVEVIVSGTEEQVGQVLQNMEGIESYNIEPAQEADAVRVTAETSGDADIRKELSLALSKNNIPILSMNRVEKSLEDIFLELTQKEEKSEIQEPAEEADAAEEAASTEAQEIADGTADHAGNGEEETGDAGDL